MKWSPEQVTELTEMCMAEKSNADMAEHFGVTVTEIHAKRSALGITIPKVKAMQGNPPLTVNLEFEAAVQKAERSMPKGLETFYNAGDTCIVLARKGDTSLIVRPSNPCTPFVVPLQHLPGATDWWQGHYFAELEPAFNYYLEAAGEEVK